MVLSRCDLVGQRNLWGVWFRATIYQAFSVLFGWPLAFGVLQVASSFPVVFLATACGRSGAAAAWALLSAASNKTAPLSYIQQYLLVTFHVENS